MKTKQTPQAKLADRLRAQSQVENQVHTPGSYEVNVAQRYMSAQTGRHQYRHLFATHARSLVTAEDAAAVLLLLRERFPAPEFHVSASAQYAFGRQLGA